MNTEKSFFNALKITKMRLYEESNTVELFAAPLPAFDDERFPSPFKFVYKSQFAKELARKFEKGEVVHIEAKAEAYKAYVYGKRGLPIKYPDGSPRETVKTRFRILKIYKGIKVGRWR